MFFYKDRCFCILECGNRECYRNLMNIPGDNELPVSMKRFEPCESWKKLKSMRGVPEFAKRVWENEYLYTESKEKRKISS